MIKGSISTDGYPLPPETLFLDFSFFQRGRRPLNVTYNLLAAFQFDTR